MDRIPTKAALIRRRINIQDETCSLCGNGEEDVMHLFTGCGFALGVWDAVGCWCKIMPIFAFDFRDLLGVQDQVAGCKWAKKVVRGIVMITCWVIWRSRNAKVFQGTCSKVVDVVALVKSWSILWLKNRSKFSGLV
ncbi:uncharacterized protein LOC118486379 [Helianthus annuus]|uniref:uncharacterized protein LOC118486379 n=1 Tax=Helianthus annuus TaxID=4232 RepID=UPI001652FC60|nr:uncharacterized protein LOC118486379 [Helianthus annuus]